MESSPWLHDTLGAPAALLDPGAMVERLTPLSAAGPGTSERSVVIRYLEYRPGESIVVQYRCIGPTGSVHDVVAASRSDGPFTSVGDQSVGDQSVGVWVYPEDPELQLLSAEASELSLALGVELRGDRTRLAWVPGRRAVLGFEGVIVKMYGTVSEARAAHTALLVLGDQLSTAQLRGAKTELGLVAQERLAGVGLGLHDAVEYVPHVSALLGDLRQCRSRVTSDADVTFELPVYGPATALTAALAPAELVGFVAPEFSSRIARVVEAVRGAAPNEPIPDHPSGAHLVTSHGDFNVGQLRLVPDETGQSRLHVLDLDTACRAAPALDLASYVANLHSGRPDDSARAAMVMALLTERLGTPGDLDWYVAVALLRRLDRPFRRWKRNWRTRTESLLVAVESAVDVLDKSAVDVLDK